MNTPSPFQMGITSHPGGFLQSSPHSGGPLSFEGSQNVCSGYCLRLASVLHPSLNELFYESTESIQL